ncbi:RagB/SusD family nutrient uptake outer membrane protein [Pedobacter hiemivivus]|uniref:RagB/SusD family nutrient uptake outer membrane protein n=1 Tax=Pedobacter hiemivivus TaxID=2530454 RepID=A0A4U1GI99_9SPHI|nr:RagB/SusD family nutrient uptake outer membrane protein [Pedobacter hiemivivus]TKC63987.1 RagB/SusD family nutrient uptake outer membrane protein [Pedobacter hiemivivus]
MAQKYKYILLLVFTSVCFSGCKKFLSIQPEDKYIEEQVFSNEKAIQQGLNGLYMGLASNTLYGANLSTTTIEMLGQRYNTVVASNNSYVAFQTYGYANTTVMAAFDEIWIQAYASITKTNKFISGLDAASQRGVISQQNASLLKGEAIGIRAMLHFDLLRLYGPIFAVAPGNPAIPYYSKAEGVTKPILTASQVLDSVLADLSTAKTLLAADPVITGGITIGNNFYSAYRNQRLNYYAVMGLQARAYLYGGNKTAANQSAKQALAEGEKWFPWLDPKLITQGVSPDRVFSPEVMFGVYNQSMYTNFTKYFSPDLLAGDLLTALPARLLSIYEGTNATIVDYRYAKTWVPEKVDAAANPPTVQTSVKFTDVADKTKSWRFVQPLLRKTELYYILAETEPDQTTAINYLNTVRYNRGIAVNLTNTAVLATEVQKEYQKEFWGEGQLFFYYKRTNKTSIPSGTSTGNVTMNAAKYVVPLPLSETTPR